MLSFELSAIDVILVISVIVLFILYMTKLSAKKPDEELSEHLMETNMKQKKQKEIRKTSFGKHIRSFMNIFGKKPKSKPVYVHQNDITECPRGFGKIRKLSERDSVSEICSGCYNLMDCYGENKIEITHH